ncbi:MAG: transporter substrate-binding domain-containing protein [Thermodesulfobacteriota bacterium]
MGVWRKSRPGAGAKWWLAGACLLACLLALALAAPPAQAGPALARVLAAGELRVGLDPAFPPLEARDKKGELVGFDVDLARLAAAALGVRLRLVDMPFADLLPALAEGRLDLVISGVTMTAERNRQVAFVGPYLVAGQTLLLRRGLLAKVRTPADLDRADHTLAATRATTAAEAARRTMPQARLVVTDNEQEAFALVRSGKADAMVADMPFNAFMAFRHPEAGLVHLDSPFTFEPLGIALAQGDPDLANFLTNLLMQLKGNGELDRLGQKWFQEPGWVKDLP